MPSEARTPLMQKAARLLARRPYSRGELALRLEKFASREQIVRALDRLQELNLLNDEEYAYNLGFRALRDLGWGPLRVSQDLARRKISPQVRDRVLERLQEEMPFERHLEAYLDRYFRQHSPPADPKALRRLIGHLARRGYPPDLIMPVLKERMRDESWIPDTGDAHC